MTPRRSIPFLIALNLATFGITFWGSVSNPNLYQFKLQVLASRDTINTLLGLFASGGLIVATLTQPLMGLRSDRTRSRFGRRVPYLLVGAFGVVIAAFAITGAGSLLVLFGAILFSQFASNTIQGPWQALAPDQVPDSQKGASAGVKTIFDLLAVLASGVAVKLLLGSGQVGLVPLVASVVIVAAVLTTVIAAPDVESTTPETPAEPLENPLTRLRRIDLREHPGLVWWLANRFLFWAGLTAVRQFIISYLQDVGHYSETAAQGISGDFTILLGVGVILVTLPAGLLSDRVGRTRLIAISCLVAGAAAVLLIFARQADPLRLIAVVAGTGAGMYFSVNWALVTTLVPMREAALFLGIANIATTLGSIAGQLGGPLTDLINHASGTLNGYFVLFGLAALCFLLSAAAILRIEERVPAAAVTAPGASPVLPPES